MGKTFFAFNLLLHNLYSIFGEILSSSKKGSPRWYFGNHQDSIRICQEYRAPDYFITITGKPK